MGPKSLLPILACACAPLAATFYLDPAQGSMANPGTSAAPWTTLEAVFAAGKIESRQPKDHPYAAGGALVAKNAGAPAKAGDTLMLRDGYHGKVLAAEYYNADFITIRAQPGHHPRLASLEIRSAAKWKVEGLTLSPSFAPAYAVGTILAFANHSYTGPVSDCVAEGCVLYSVPDASAWTKEDWNAKACDGLDMDGPRCRATADTVRNANFALVASGDSDVVERCFITDFSGDGMRGLGNRQMFLYNHVQNSYQVNDNHCDGFQSWTTGPGGVGTGEIAGMVLRGNTILNHTNPNHPFRSDLQGIGCFDGMFRGWTVEDNVIITDTWHGITLLGAIDCKVVNNTVVDLVPGQPGPPWISVEAHKDGRPPSGCLVANNLATAYSIADTGVTLSHNVTVDPSRYAQYFADFSPEAGRFDLRLKAGSPAIGAALPLYAPPLDHDGVARPQGGTPDAGAYEYPAPALAARVSPRYPTHAGYGNPRDASGRRLRPRARPAAAIAFPARAGG